MTAARIPFTPEDESKISSLGMWMMVVAIIHVVIGLIVVALSCCGLIGIAQMLTQGLSGILGAITTGLGLLAGPVLLIQAFLLFKGKQGLDTVVNSDTNDQTELAGVFQQVKVFFMIEVAYALIQIVITCLQGVAPFTGAGL